MKKSKWFNGAKFVPAHVGVYETNAGQTKFYQYWHGSYWGLCMMSIDSAFRHRDGPSVFQNATWRGIKK